MTQTKRFIKPVCKADGSGDIIEAGNSVGFILKDGSISNEVVTGVKRWGRVIEWDNVANGLRSKDVRGVDGIHSRNCTGVLPLLPLSDAYETLGFPGGDFDMVYLGFIVNGMKAYEVSGGGDPHRMIFVEDHWQIQRGFPSAVEILFTNLSTNPTDPSWTGGGTLSPI